jgi:hypothetical protein
MLTAAALPAALPLASAPSLAARGPAKSPRKAMEAYASWLFMERRILCMELYPDAGADAERWDLANNAGYGWHFEKDGKHWKDVPPSTRAAAVLDAVGVDWADYQQEPGWPLYQDSGIRPKFPAQWPHVDGELTAASFELAVVDLAIDGLHKQFGDDADSRDDYHELEDMRARAIEVLADREPRSWDGICAKACALRHRSVIENHEETASIAASLAAAIMGIPVKAASA